MSKNSSWWDVVVAVARAILHDRRTRRKWLSCAVLLMLGVFALGFWGLDEWLGQSVLRFCVWWLGCASLALLVMIFAFYDALAVVREERKKQR